MGEEELDLLSFFEKYKIPRKYEEFLEEFRRAKEIDPERAKRLKEAKDLFMRRGLIYKDENGKERFIWQRDLEVQFTEDFLPRRVSDIKKLEEIIRNLRELKSKGAEKLLKILLCSEKYIKWSPEGILWINRELAKKVLGEIMRFDFNLFFNRCDFIFVSHFVLLVRFMAFITIRVPDQLKENEEG